MATPQYRRDLVPGMEESGYYFQLTRGRTLCRDPHCHQFYEILCVLSGACTHYINGRRLDCREGTLTFLRPNDVHYFDGQREGTDIAALSVAPDEMRKFLIAYGLEQSPLYAQDAPGDESFPILTFTPGELMPFCHLCEAAFAIADARTQRCKLLLGQILSGLLESAHRTEGTLPEQFARSLAEMNQLDNAAEGVQAFLRISNFSHAQLCRLTRRYLNMTPGEYVTRIRLQYAYELISYGRQDYEAICETVGFSSFSHFNSLIRQKFGQTPAQLRRQAQLRSRTV